MSYIAPEVLKEVKKMDLLTYLKNYEPYELMHFSGNTYTTRTHDSLKISNGKWMWWSRGIGGRSALDYLIKVREYSFMEAVEILMGYAATQQHGYVKAEAKKEKILLLPKPNEDNEKVIAYLKNRGIDEEIIQFGIQTGTIYESENYHNAVFVGRDEKGIPRYAALRGIYSDFIGDASGSDKKYSFSISAEKENGCLHVFEAVIDLFSYATIQKYQGEKWRGEHLLSLAGVYQPAKKMEESKVPATVIRYLKVHPEIKEIIFHLDNDRAGRNATKAIQTVLPKRYLIRDEPPKQGKDYNDYLCLKLGMKTTKRVKRNLEKGTEK